MPSAKSRTETRIRLFRKYYLKSVWTNLNESIAYSKYCYTSAYLPIVHLHQHAAVQVALPVVTSADFYSELLGLVDESVDDPLEALVVGEPGEELLVDGVDPDGGLEGAEPAFGEVLVESVLNNIFNNRLKDLYLHLFGIYIHINQQWRNFKIAPNAFFPPRTSWRSTAATTSVSPAPTNSPKGSSNSKMAALPTSAARSVGNTLRSLVGESKQQDLKQNTSLKRGEINIQQVSLYCFTCHTKCFTIDQYLAGSHKGHDVRNVRKAYQSLRLLLQSSLEKVKGKVDQTVSDVSKITILKRNCLQQLSQLKKRIKLNFGKIKKMIEEKETQLQKEGQEQANRNLQELQRNILTIQNLGEALQQTELKIKERLSNEAPSLQEIIDSFNFYSKQRESLLQRLKLADSFNHEQFFKRFQFNYSFNLDLILQKYQNLKALDFNLLDEKDSSLHCSFIQQTKDSFKSARNPKNSLAKTVSSPSLRQDLESAKNISQMFKNFRERQLTGRCQRTSHERMSASPIQICMAKKEFKQNRNGRLDQRINKLRKLIQS